MKVLNYGSVNIDLVYKVPHTVRPGETLSSYELSTHPGGKGANQSAALAKAGVKVYHAGKIGKEGEWILDKLKSFGVDTGFVKIGDCKTGHAVIQVSDNGENAIFLFGGGNREITKGEIDDVLRNFVTGDILLLQNEINNIPCIMEAASAKGLRIFFNPAPFSGEILTYPLDLVDTFIVNEIEGMGLSQNASNFENIMDNLTLKFKGKPIILTLGDKGVLYGKDGERIFSEAIDVDVVDTTAAGDTFIGFYIAGLVESLPVEEILSRSSRASSITVSRPGAMEAIPFVEELAEG